MDQQILLWINSFAGKNQILDNLAIFLAEYLWLILIAVVLIAWSKKYFEKQATLGLLSGFVSRVVITEIIKRIADRPRPFEIMEVTKLVAKETGGSFPSGHAVVAFSLAFAFWDTKWFWPLLVLALLVSLSRIYVGIHYPSDILGSIVIAGIMVWIIKKWQNKIT